MLGFRHFAVAGRVALLGGALASAGCAADDDAAAVETESEIIGGTTSREPSLDAVGAVVEIFSIAGGTQATESFCTATLIAPSVIVTAEHCVPEAMGSRKLGFALGPHGNTDVAAGTGPTRIVRIRSSEAETTVVGGTIGLGSDVAVFHLETPITDIEPLEIGVLGPSDIDTPFLAVGYGVHDERAASDGVRRSTTLTLRALEGKILPPLVSYDDYHSASGFSDAEDRAYYDSTALLAGYEALTAGATGQLCSGDSGGPLLRKDGGKLVVYGVGSWVLATATAGCALGSVHAIFGEHTRTFLEKHLREDP